MLAVRKILKNLILEEDKTSWRTIFGAKVGTCWDQATYRNTSTNRAKRACL